MGSCATSNPAIKQQARFLAEENRKAEPDIGKVYWFPHDQEVRLVELSKIMPASQENELHPFYFNASPEDGLPAPSGVTIIRPEEFGKLKLPPDWCDWSEAVEL
jgi:hypothetical protein